MGGKNTTEVGERFYWWEYEGRKDTEFLEVQASPSLWEDWETMHVLVIWLVMFRAELQPRFKSFASRWNFSTEAWEQNGHVWQSCSEGIPGAAMKHSMWWIGAPIAIAMWNTGTCPQGCRGITLSGQQHGITPTQATAPLCLWPSCTARWHGEPSGDCWHWLRASLATSQHCQDNHLCWEEPRWGSISLLDQSNSITLFRTLIY